MTTAVARPVLFLHGAAGDARVWGPVLAALTGPVAPHALSFTYFGEAPWPDDGANFGHETHAAQVIAAIEALDAGPMALVAWSYAVHVALLVTLRRPDLVRALLLYEPGFGTYVTDPDDLAQLGVDVAAAFGPVGTMLQTDGPETAVKGLIDALCGAGCFKALPADRQRIYLDNAAIMPRVLGGGAPPVTISQSALATLALPVTVARGDRSRPCIAIPSRTLARAVPGARLSILPDAGHMLPEMAPGRFAALVDAWMESLT